MKIENHRFRLNKIFENKIVNIFIPVSFNICFESQKNRLIETVLLSTTTYVLIEK